MTIKRDTWVGIGAGVAAFALVAVVFFFLARQSASGGGIEGVITAKQFERAPETQITVGSGGVHQREIPGECTFLVKADRVYAVTVDPKTYAEHQVGDKFYFIRPAANPSQ